MFRTFSIGIVLLFAVSALIAQQTEDKATSDSALPKTLSGGVLNGKATSLPKPAFPPAARAVGASGTVSVRVLIDENGDIVSATAVSGHPLLRAAAVEAAKGAKFSPTLLAGVPVKVSGIITYNFVGELTPAGLGFQVMLAERSGSFINHTPPAALASQLPADWVEEKRILTSLTFEQAPDVVVPPAAPAAAPPAKMEIKPDKNRYTIKGDIYSAASSSSYEKLDAKSISAVGDLRSMLTQRMAVDERAAWNFELGTELGALHAESSEAKKVRSHLATLDTIVARAPATANETSMRELREFLESVKTGKIEGDMRVIVQQLANLKY